ncbi:MAG: type III-B CRISPR module RAMP protein Cmr4 [Verrucomicrobiales bacterium]|nr:type III-B CRISPR module RAMP protein Cmr4 [Verrucomicrobiales bacterium]
MTTKNLYLFTRTPLHVGAGASVGAIDQPVQRERHTGFPIIPASSLKGSFADQWNDGLLEEETKDGKRRVRVNQKGEIAEAAWLFGSDSDKPAFAGSLIFSEARILAFPIRSAKGSYAWITCPLMLERAVRDGVVSGPIPPEPKDAEALFNPDGPLALSKQIVLEEYCFTHAGAYPDQLAKSLGALVRDDCFKSITDRLVILSNGMMSHFATTACEVAQHVRISDETGTAEGTGLFNQENVPADTLFYSVLSATKSRVPNGEYKNKTETDALQRFASKIADNQHVFQFGGDASTGLGFCTVTTNIGTKGE